MGIVEIAASDALFGSCYFVADYGEPSMFEEPIMCKGCTMCCKYLISSIYCVLSFSLENILKSSTCCMNYNISLFKAIHLGFVDLRKKKLWWRNGDSKIFDISHTSSS